MSSWNVVFGEYVSLLEHMSRLSPLIDELSEIDHHQKVSFSYKKLINENLYKKFKLKNSESKSIAQASEYRNLGNRLFSEKLNIDALHLYTKSVACAPTNSRELALAYGNRSAALFYLDRYASSLVDINRALNLSYPENLKPKLLARKKTCVEKLKELNEQTESKLEYLKNLSVTNDWIIDDVILQVFKTYEIHDEDALSIDCSHKCSLPEVELNNKFLIKATDKIKVDYNEEIGRHLIATADIEPGNAIIINKPFAATLLPGFTFTHCSNCYLRCEALIQCDKCSTIMFCSEKCKKEAVESFHEAECSFMHLIISMGHNVTTMLALRAFIIASKQKKNLKDFMSHPVFSRPFQRVAFDAKTVHNPGDYASIHHMVDNFERSDEHFLLYRCYTCALLVHVLREHGYFDSHDTENLSNVGGTQDELNELESFAGTLLLRLMYAADCNALEISETLEEEANSSIKFSPIGACFYASLSIVNHSCNPNVVRISHKNYAVLYTLLPIAAGEQVLDNYGLHFTTSTLEQRQTLFKNYLFTCKCEACTFDWPLYEKLPECKPKLLSDDTDNADLIEYSKKFHELLSNPLFSRIMNRKNFLRDYLILLRKTVKPPWKEFLACEEALRHHFLTHTANYYTYYSDLIM